MKCPNCIDSTLVMADRSGIEIDYCPDCRGVWLDRGELDKLIERSAPQQEVRDTSDNFRGTYRNDKDHDYRYKKKKGLFGELFDF